MKLIKLKQILVLATMMLSAGNLFAQRPADAVVDFKSEIACITLNPYTGSVVVMDKDEISSYNPETKQVEWTITQDKLSSLNKAKELFNAAKLASSGDLSALLDKKKGSVEFIPNTPLLSFEMLGQDVIANSTDGTIVFNSGKIGYRILETLFLEEEMALLFMTTEGSTYNCVYFDLNTGTERWTTQLTSMEMLFKFFGSFLSFSIDKKETQDKIISVDNDIYMCVNSILYKLNKNTGELEWKTDYKITNFFVSQTAENVVMYRKTKGLLSSKYDLNILNAKTGEKVWKNDVETKYITYLEDNGDKILIAHAKGFNFYNFADGKKVWKKDAKGKEIKKVISVGKDYLYVADREMNLIDENGKNKWKKFIEICDNDEDIVYYLGKVDNNRVLYLTDTYGNMVDYTSGKKIWKKNIEFDKKRPLLDAYDQNRNVYMVYNNKRLYKFDPNTKDKPNEFAKFREIKDDKTMSGIELFDWGVCLTSQSEVIGISTSGEVKYHNKYDEPGGGLRKTLKVTGNVGAGVLSVYSGVMSSLADAETVMHYRDENGNVVEDRAYLFTDESRAAMHKAADRADFGASLINTGLLSKVKNRFNALKQNNEYAFLITKNKTDGKPYLVKVKKDDGAEVDMVEIDSNKPIYEVDPVSDNIYYVSKNQLKIFSKK